MSVVIKESACVFYNYRERFLVVIARCNFCSNKEAHPPSSPSPPHPRPRPKPHPPLLDIIIVHKKNIFPGYSSVNKCTFFSFVVATVFCFFSTRFLFSRWFSNTSFVASERAFTLSLSRCFSVVFVSSRCKIRPRFIFLSLGAT